MNIAVIGAQWGDEGKGKVIDYLARKKKVKTVVRFQGGPNAGHTVVVGGERFALHLIPSGILYPDKTSVIGNNVILNLEGLAGELKGIEARVGWRHSRLLISDKCHVILPWHKLRDSLDCGKIGTTGRGIGPCYEDSVGRRGIRLAEALQPHVFAERIREALNWNKKIIRALGGKLNLTAEAVIRECQKYLRQILGNPRVRVSDVTEYLAKQPDGILFEGAQGTMLDINHGSYPFVTSSNSTIGGLYTGSGFRPRKLAVIGVTKAYSTRVGSGPFPTELAGGLGDKIRETGHEYGTTTGRPRRCGWLDTALLNYAKKINGLDSLALTKLDVLSGMKQLKIGVRYQGKRVIYEILPGWKETIGKIRKFRLLPPAARRYITRVEQLSGVPIKLIGVGPERHQIIHHV
jgi:adenylosuccinate synthase